MNEIKPYNLKVWACPICHEEHEIDSTGWVQSCIGYIELGNMIRKIAEWLENRLEGRTQSRTSTKENTKGNTRRKKNAKV